MKPGAVEAVLADNANLRYRILSIDGGPAAPLQIRMLRKIEEAYPGFVASTHQFAGTSDGALLALFIASRLPADNEAAKRISLDILDDAIAFSNATIRALQPTATTMLRFLSGTGALVDAAALHRILEQAFGDMKLTEIERDCLITSFNVDDMSADVVIKLGDFCPLDRTLVDALLATSALPMYMPLHPIDGQRYVDGVIHANDSSFDAMWATTIGVRMKAVSMRNNPGEKAFKGFPALEAALSRTFLPTFEERCAGFRMLSLGLQQGNRKVYVSETLVKRMFGDRFKDYDKKADWGWFQWIVNRPRLLPAMMYGASNDKMTNLCELLFPNRFFRYAPRDEVIGEVWRVMSRHAQELLDHADELANELWQQGIDRKSPDGSSPHTSELLDFVKAEWLDP